MAVCGKGGAQGRDTARVCACEHVCVRVCTREWTMHTHSQHRAAARSRTLSAGSASRRRPPAAACKRSPRLRGARLRSAPPPPPPPPPAAAKSATRAGARRRLPAERAGGPVLRTVVAIERRAIRTPARRRLGVAAAGGADTRAPDLRMAAGEPARGAPGCAVPRLVPPHPRRRHAPSLAQRRPSPAAMAAWRRRRPCFSHFALFTATAAGGPHCAHVRRGLHTPGGWHHDRWQRRSGAGLAGRRQAAARAARPVTIESPRLAAAAALAEHAP